VFFHDTRKIALKTKLVLQVPASS